MSIITISHDFCSHGRETAEKVGNHLAYEVIGPEVVQEAGEEMDLPRSVVASALHDSPRVLDKLLAKKERRIALFRAAFYKHMLQDNIVYHGWAGHVFLADIPNVFKVRLFADMEDRIREEMSREGVSRRRAKKRLKADDAERKKWTKYLYGHDNHDPELYDLYINLHGIDVDKATLVILNAHKIFTNGYIPQMKQRLVDLALEAKVEARLLSVFPEVEVEVRDGEVFGRVEASIVQEDLVVRKARAVLSDIEGIKRVAVGVKPSFFAPF